MSNFMRDPTNLAAEERHIGSHRIRSGAGFLHGNRDDGKADSDTKNKQS